MKRYLVYVFSNNELKKEAYPESNPPSQKELDELKKILKARIYLGESTLDGRLKITKKF